MANVLRLLVRSRALVAAGVMLAGFAVLAPPVRTSGLARAQPYVPVWQPVACKHTLVPQSTTYCGYLIVPERRSNPTGPTVKVYHTIMPALDGSTNHVPLMYVTGGPGASTAGAVSLFEDPTGPAGIYRQRFGATRDLIIIDQRGTNQSIPALYCSDELAPTRDEVYGSDFELAANLRVNALSRCRDRWVQQGVNLSGYNELEVAADIADFLSVRQIPKINLYGASWGTRVSMQVMKLYPQLLNAVVIDSILPPELDPFVAEVQGTQHGMQALIDNSVGDYPLIASYISTILTRLRAAPVNVIGYHYADGGGSCSAPGSGGEPHLVHVTADKFIDYLANQLRSTPYCGNLPQNIKYIYDQQRYDFLADNWISSMDFSFSAGDGSTGAAADGLFQSAFAANDAFFATPLDVFDNILQRVTDPSLAEWLANSFVYREACMLGVWPVDSLPASVRDPVVSSIPTLMLVGGLDVATPSIFSRPSEAGLSNHVYYEITSGHATAYLPCVLDMLDSWYKTPGVAPVNSCPTTYSWLPPASHPVMSLDLPVSGPRPPGAFQAAGWAIDQGAVTGAGVDAVHVWAFPVVGDDQFGSPIFLGAATVGLARADVGAAVGDQYVNSGFSLTAAALPLGSYEIRAYAHSSVTGTFVAERSSDIVVTPPASNPVMSLDTPQPGANLGQSFTVAGWAADRNATSGPGVGEVDVWAYPIAGGTLGTPVFLGAATYGTARQDVGAILGSQFTNSGFSLPATLPPGTYRLIAFAQSTVTGTFNDSRVADVAVH